MGDVIIDRNSRNCQKMDFVSQSNSATDAAGNLIFKHYSNMVLNI